MDAAARQLIEAIHRTSRKCVLAATGGGTQAVAMLLGVPGGSRTILEVTVPYQEQTLADFLGWQPDQYCSPATSQAMAVRARERAGWLAPGESVVGLGCTASLATDRTKRGDHRFHVSVCTALNLATCSLVLAKGARDRLGEESILDAVLLNAAAEAFSVPDRVPVPLVADEHLEHTAEAASDPVARLMRAEATLLGVDMDGRFSATDPGPRAILPGAFNPVHSGHWGLADAAARILGFPVAFELSVTNVDKPPLRVEEVRQRMQQFAWRAPLWLTRAPLFLDKAALFPGAVFVVGEDTAERLVAPRYYDGSEQRMVEALNSIGNRGCRFLVGARSEPRGEPIGLEAISIPAPVRHLFADIPRSEFHHDISSTQLRRLTPVQRL